jgi:iron complex outermembrane receptor protein
MAMKISTILSSLASILAVALLPSAVVAQTDSSDENVLEEIIVTATKREKNIQDVPIAISAITAKDIESAGLTRVEEMTLLVPNFTYAQTTTKKITALVIRGLSSSGGIGNDPNIGVYIDGVYIGRDSGFNSGLMDIERVEVLKGPQGTLFGRNSTTGALNITTRKPSQDGFVEIEGSVGDLSYTRLGVSAGGAFSENVMGKISVSKSDRDGYLDNTFGGTANDIDNLFVRGQLLIAPNDKLAITLSADYNEDKGNGNNYKSASPGDPTNYERVVSIPDLGSEDRDIYGVAATIEYTLDSGYEITSISATRNIDEKSTVDGDYSPLELNVFGDDREQSSFSQELRIASPSGERFEWVAGVYYFDQEFTAVTDTFSGPDTIFAFGGAFFDPFFFSLIGTGSTPTDFGLPANSGQVLTNARIDTESLAAFASGSYDLSDQWSITAGIRYTDDDKNLTFSQVSDPISQAFFPEIDCADPSFGCQNSQRDNQWTPQISLEFRPTDDILTYLKYSEGFNSGGFNANLYGGIAPLSFGPETVESWELGFKSTLADNRVRLNVAVFDTDYLNKQESFFLASAGGFVQTNAGAAESKGFEIEFTALPMDGLEVFGSVGSADAKYTDYGDNTGNKLQNAPDLQWNLGGQYEWAMSNTLNGSIRADVFYQDKRFLQADNDPFFVFEETTMVNLRLGLGSDDGKWLVTAWARNLFEDDAVVQIFGGSSPFIPSYNYAPNAPRTIGVDFRYAF